MSMRDESSYNDALSSAPEVSTGHWPQPPPIPGASQGPYPLQQPHLDSPPGTSPFGDQNPVGFPSIPTASPRPRDLLPSQPSFHFSVDAREQLLQPSLLPVSADASPLRPVASSSNSLARDPTSSQNYVPSHRNSLVAMENDASHVTLKSALDELAHLSIQPSRLTIMDSTEVGCGRYGEVLLAILDGSSEAPAVFVAVKQLRTVGTRGSRHRLALRLARELKIWAKANHPHILRLVGYYLSENYEIAQFISPFMRNGNVSQYLEREKVGALRRLDIIRDITLGMNYLHGCDPPICHGDLKPTNVLMNDDLHAVLCDFGLASFVLASDLASGLTTTQSIRGSIRYMSPELHLADEPKHTLASDVWAWGCTAYEIVTNDIPYGAAKTDSAIIKAFLQEDLPGTIDTLMTRVPDDTPPHAMQKLHRLQMCLQRCWGISGEQRPQMPDLLHEILSDKLVDVMPLAAPQLPIARKVSISSNGDARKKEHSDGFSRAITSPEAKTMAGSSGASDSKPRSVQNLSLLPQSSPDRGLSTSLIKGRTPWFRPRNDPAPRNDTQDLAPSATSPAPIMWTKDAIRKVWNWIRKKPSPNSQRRGSTSTASDPYDEEYAAGLPTPDISPKPQRMRRFSSVSDPTSSVRVQIRDQHPPPVTQLFPDRGVSSSPVQERGPWSRPSNDHPPQDDSQDPPPPPTSPTPRMRFKDAVKKVRNLERMKPTRKSPKSPGGHARERSLTLPSSSDGHADPNERFALRPTRLAGLIPKLKALKPTQELIDHVGLVRHLQFSPDGKWLATCSWDRKAIIWKVDATLTPHRVLAHAGAGFLSQVAWSPDGKFLLTRTYRHVKVWLAETGVLKQTISCKTKVEAVTWMPTGGSFACVEGSVVHIMDLLGKIKADHTFERLDIHDAAVTQDEQRMILVATLQSSKEDLKPSKSRAEKRIIVYNLVYKKVECQVPVLENVRDVTISSDNSNGYLALISYEDTAPPELWRIGVVYVQSRQETETRLQLLQTYMPTAQVEFAGPSYLGGTQDEFVICAGRKGDIYIWDRETGLLLHSLQGANMIENTPGDLTAVAWNHCATGRYMFASATNDGTVKIWTAQAPPDSQQPSWAGSPTPSVPRPASAAIGLAA